MKDRSAPFSRKHRRYWLPVTGGMLLIGAINVGIGYCSWPGDSMDRPPDRIEPQIPVSEFARPDAAPDATSDARPDAASDAVIDAAPGASPAAAPTKAPTKAPTEAPPPAPASAPLEPAAAAPRR